jgi:hypothetical protein
VRDLREKIYQEPEYYWKLIDGEVRNLGRFKQERAYRKQRKSIEISYSDNMMEGSDSEPDIDPVNDMRATSVNDRTIIWY